MRRFALLVGVLSCAEPSSVGTDSRETEPLLAEEPGRVRVQGILTIVVTPNPATVATGASVPLTVTATNDAGQTFTPSGATFSTSAPSVATVSATGLVSGIAVGTATITSTAKNGVQGSTIVNVTAAPPPTGQILLAAGDVAVCPTTMDEATANILDGQPGTIAALGDLAYPNGTAAEFANCYGPSWGRHRARTMPAVGNHEYVTANAAGYYGFFGSAAGDPAKGYYSYTLGAWHIIVLNSNCSFVSCAAGSGQDLWLRADLAANTSACILAYWHHPRFSSGTSHGNDVTVAPFWNALYQYGADVVLNGHSHFYERFGLQNPSAVADPNGIREFIVGTGGKTPLTGFTAPKANSQIRQNTTFGVLKLNLASNSYSWNFLPIAGSTWTDSGTQPCH